MRLIDADKLIEKIEKDKFTYAITYYQSGYNDGLFHVGVVVDNFPTVDIERDIPKAPTDQQLEEDGYGAWGSLYGHCPNCKGTVYDEQNYCEKCGQRLDWGNGNKEIDAIPTIEAAFVKHGKWLPKHHYIAGYEFVSGHICSECGNDALNAEGDDFLTDFCPMCGAKMDG